MNAVSSVYQKDRTLAESLCALKAGLEAIGIARRHMLPPLRDCADTEVARIRTELQRQGLIA
jgi:hypothetical protein